MANKKFLTIVGLFLLWVLAGGAVTSAIIR
jgi:hypothetical protein